ncbi:MAG: ChaN family lipoprotein [Burkholderiaceae bacterium]|nr:ChaN family lipoprotein [Burkholderiaceae bacterium]
MNATVDERSVPRRPIPPSGRARFRRLGARIGSEARVAARLACALVFAAALGACAASGATAPAGAGSPRPANGAQPGVAGSSRASVASDLRPDAATAAQPGVGIVALPTAAVDADFLLLGELHDNVAQHRLRLHWLEALVERHPFALALEQFDANRQEALDRARAADTREAHDASGADLASRARRIAQAAGFDFRGWDWDLYRPAIELALRRGLPLVAANLSPADTARVAKGSAPPVAPPPGWGAHEVEAMRASIRQGHCDLLPEPAVDAMAVAQRTRDARIARALVEARERTGLPVVLLAGNGHLRRDIGVPRHLRALRPRARVVSIALLERTALDDEDAGPEPDRRSFDLVVRTDAQPREDPCEGLRKRMRPKSY